ncbi:unnamed protein product, partial [Hydatigera taeniaeformis]
MNSIDSRVSMSFFRPPLIPGRIQKTRSDILNSIDSLERALRLATTLLSPNICFIIAHLTSAIRNIRSNISDSICTDDYFPLSSVESMAGLMAPILFPTLSETKVTRNSGVECCEWREVLLSTLFSVDDGKCIEPIELLSDV